MSDVLDKEPFREQDIPAWAVDLAEAKVEKVNKRAARAGITEQYRVEVERYEQVIVDPDTKLERRVKRAVVRIWGDLLRLPGYRFAATVDWSLGLDKPLLRRNGSLPEELVIAAPSEKRCDHCGTVRDRADTYLVIEEATGELKQVGRNCLAAYCGLSPAWVNTYGDDAPLLDDEELEEHERKFRHAPFADLAVRDLLAVTHVIVENDGSYKPRAFGEDSTTSRVWLVIGDTLKVDHPDYFVQKQLRELVIDMRDEVLPLADADVAWALALEPGDNDFLYNLKTIAEAGYVTARQVGLTVAMVPARQRELVKVAERAERGPVPTGTGLVIEGVIERAWLREGDYGDQYKMWVRLANGSRVYSTIPASVVDSLVTLTEYGSRFEGIDKLVGKTVRFTASVEAAHDDPTTGFAKRPRKAELVA